MLKKTVSYVDFDGNNRTEDLYFNLTQSELMEIAMELPEEFKDIVGDDPTKVDEKIAATQLVEKLGGKGIYQFLKNLLIKSYGIKSADGRKFEKTDAIASDFSHTLAFDTLFMELLSDDIAAANFVNNVIPGNIAKNMKTIEGGAQPAN